MKKRIMAMSLLALFFILGQAWALRSPVDLLQGISNRMIVQLEQNKSHLKQRGVVHSIVRDTLLPYVDLNRMSALVVGPNYWRSASSVQKAQFKQEFTRMVISTYSTALSSYDNDRVSFYPLRGGYSGNTVHVNSVIVRRSGQRIPMSYNLVRSDGGWLVYDFSVENVSIVQSYRAQFAGVLSSSGMDGLVQRLIQHNRKSR